MRQCPDVWGNECVTTRGGTLGLSFLWGGSTIRTSGCGPTALAIVISTLTGEQITPELTAQYAMDTGGYVSGTWNQPCISGKCSRNWGLSVERVRREQMMNYVVAELKNGKACGGNLRGEYDIRKQRTLYRINRSDQ